LFFRPLATFTKGIRRAKVGCSAEGASTSLQAAENAPLRELLASAVEELRCKPQQRFVEIRIGAFCAQQSLFADIRSCPFILNHLQLR
jgi:hypothetical protein